MHLIIVLLKGKLSLFRRSEHAYANFIAISIYGSCIVYFQYTVFSGYIYSLYIIIYTMIHSINFDYRVKKNELQKSAD